MKDGRLKEESETPRRRLSDRASDRPRKTRGYVERATAQGHSGRGLGERAAPPARPIAPEGAAAFTLPHARGRPPAQGRPSPVTSAGRRNPKGPRRRPRPGLGRPRTAHRFSASGGGNRGRNRSGRQSRCRPAGNRRAPGPPLAAHRPAVAPGTRAAAGSRRAQAHRRARQAGQCQPTRRQRSRAWAAPVPRAARASTTAMDLTLIRLLRLVLTSPSFNAPRGMQITAVR